MDRSSGLLPTSDVQRQSRGQGSYEVDLQHPEEIHASCRLGRREKERGLQEQERRSETPLAQGGKRTPLSPCGEEHARVSWYFSISKNT